MRNIKKNKVSKVTRFYGTKILFKNWAEFHLYDITTI